MAVFDFIGFFGEKNTQGVERFTKTFADGTFRTYLEGGGVALGERQLVVDEVSKTERNYIAAFHLARNQATTLANYKFTMYDSDVVNHADPTGASSTGRLEAIFLDDKITWNRVGPCRWSTNLRVFITAVG